MEEIGTSRILAAIICHGHPIGMFTSGARCGDGNFDCWHFLHAWLWRFTSLAMPTQYASWHIRCKIFSVPWWPALGASWLRQRDLWWRLVGRIRTNRSIVPAKYTHKNLELWPQRCKGGLFHCGPFSLGLGMEQACRSFEVTTSASWALQNSYME